MIRAVVQVGNEVYIHGEAGDLTLMATCPSAGKAWQVANGLRAAYTVAKKNSGPGVAISYTLPLRQLSEAPACREGWKP